MKRLEDIEKMDWQELENAASQENIPVPAGLGKRIAEMLTARAIAAEPAPKKAGRRVLWAAVAAAAVLAGVLALPTAGSPEPKDSFDDPYLAYAEVEKAFQLIGQKMSDGLDRAGEVQALVEKPLQILKNQ